MRHNVYIGLGSNIEQPYKQIRNAIIALNDLPGTRVTADSGYYTSRPMGPDDQPDFVNAVVQLETALGARELLTYCQQIELQQGRIKKRHWGERSIDLDILLYDDQQVQTDDLTIPHTGIWQRDFVYVPLLKINPEVEISGKGMLNVIVKTATESGSDYACTFVGPICWKS